jgi:RNA polymerase sigma-70 factor, ECF subfamily
MQTEAFTDFYRTHRKFVSRGSRKLGIEDAAVDDVVQNVFWVAYRRFPEFRVEGCSEDSVKSWVYAILLRVVREHRRTNRRKSPHLLLPYTDPETLPDAYHLGPHEALVRSEAARVAQGLLDGLDECKRNVFLLAELAECTRLEIADAVGVSEARVHAQLRAARRSMRRAAKRHRRRDAWRMG